MFDRHLTGQFERFGSKFTESHAKVDTGTLLKCVGRRKNRGAIPLQHYKRLYDNKL